jgi:plasmid stabilization system protein ParE
MIFTVIWKKTAENDLATIWTSAVNRRAVARAADMVDAELRRDGHTKGESRSGEDRVLIVPPLGVLFEARESDRTIEVLSVWEVPPPK